MSTSYYTHFPRTILWLIPGGTLGAEVAGRAMEVEPFYLGKTPITNRQLEAFAPDWQRSPGSPGDDDTALGVSFELAEGYAAWYAEVSRKPMRLPSDEEWLYATYAAQTEHPWGDGAADEHLWHSGNVPGDRLPPVDQRRANGFGLFGMLGGAWEWTTAETQPKRRGGSYRLGLEELVAQPPGALGAEGSFEDSGFRIARSLKARGIVKGR